MKGKSFVFLRILPNKKHPRLSHLYLENSNLLSDLVFFAEAEKLFDKYIKLFGIHSNRGKPIQGEELLPLEFTSHTNTFQVPIQESKLILVFCLPRDSTQLYL